MLYKAQNPGNFVLRSSVYLTLALLLKLLLFCQTGVCFAGVLGSCSFVAPTSFCLTVHLRSCWGCQRPQIDDVYQMAANYPDPKQAPLQPSPGRGFTNSTIPAECSSWSELKCCLHVKPWFSIPYKDKMIPFFAFSQFFPVIKFVIAVVDLTFNLPRSSKRGCFVCPKTKLLLGTHFLPGTLTGFPRQ